MKVGRCFYTLHEVVCMVVVSFAEVHASVAETLGSIAEP